MEIRNVSKVILFDKTGNLILQQRDINERTEQPGKLSLFGGSSEDDESYQETAIRELEEEIGIKVEESELAQMPSELVFNGAKIIHVHYFLLRNVLDALELVIYEGKDTTMSLEEMRESANLTPLLQAITQKVWLEDASRQVHPTLSHTQTLPYGHLVKLGL